MSGSSRKGLKRHGMRSYIVSGGGWAYIIRREGGRRWLVRDACFEHLPWIFFAVKHSSLAAARKWAQEQLWPYPAKYKNRVRRSRGKSDPRALLLAARLIAEERCKDGQ